MKNKWGSKITNILCLMLAWILLVECSGVLQVPAGTVQAEESTEEIKLEWDGVTREQVWEFDRCNVVYSLTDYWTDGYTASIVVENTSDTVIENWHISFPVEQDIVDIWNAQLIETADEITVFKNLGWNQDIAVGQSVSFGFTAKGAFEGFPEICELPASRQECAETDYEITYAVTDAWDTGHVVQFCIRNTSGRTIEDWYLSFDCIYAISDIWNGQILSWENGSYLIKNSDYNQNISAGGEVYIGFTVNGPVEDGLSGCRLEEIALGGGNSDNSGSEEGDISEGDTSGGDISDGGVSDGDVSEGDISGSDVTNGDVSDGDVTGGDVTDGDTSSGDVSKGVLGW